MAFQAEWTASSEEAGLDEHSELRDWSEVVQGAGLGMGCYRLRTRDHDSLLLVPGNPLYCNQDPLSSRTT